MKPTMYEFLHAYMHSLYEGLNDKGMSVDELAIECKYCPFKDQCRQASEEGCELSCGDYIKKQLIDGGSYR